MAGLRDAVGARVHGDAAARVHDADLAHGDERVAGQHAAQRRLGVRAVREPVEGVRAVRGLDHGLRGDGADARARPRAQRADGEPVRLDRGAELAGLRVQCDDRVRAVGPRHRAAEDTARDARSRAGRAARVLERVRNTPPGFVRTYGDVSPGAPRFAGTVLHGTDDPDVPWHRIVRADGSLAKGARQRKLLEAEGIPFRGDRVDMRAARLPD